MLVFPRCVLNINGKLTIRTIKEQGTSRREGQHSQNSLECLLFLGKYTHQAQHINTIVQVKYTLNSYCFYFFQFAVTITNEGTYVIYLGQIQSNKNILQTNTFLASYYKQLVCHNMLTSFQLANTLLKYKLCLYQISMLDKCSYF